MACSEEWACFPAWSGSRSSSPSTADGFARLRIFAGRFRTFMVFVREGPGYARWARVRQRRRRRLPPTGVGDPRPIPSAIKCRPLPPSRGVTLGAISRGCFSARSHSQTALPALAPHGICAWRGTNAIGVAHSAIEPRNCSSPADASNAALAAPKPPARGPSGVGSSQGVPWLSRMVGPDS
jgi:hypothetical protein